LRGNPFPAPPWPRRDLPKPLKPLDVGLQRLTPCPWAPATDGVSRLGQHRFDRAYLHLVVVRLDGMHHIGRLAVPPRDLRADQRMAALHLVSERLADVVQHG